LALVKVKYGFQIPDSRFQIPDLSGRSFRSAQACLRFDFWQFYKAPAAFSEGALRALAGPARIFVFRIWNRESGIWNLFYGRT